MISSPGLISGFSKNADALLPPIATSFEYQIIGGGAGGSITSPGGGGGAGGFVQSSQAWSNVAPYNNQTWTVTIGSAAPAGSSGNVSSLKAGIVVSGPTTYIANGGGAGATPVRTGGNGGSGGGGCTTTSQYNSNLKFPPGISFGKISGVPTATTGAAQGSPGGEGWMTIAGTNYYTNSAGGGGGAGGSGASGYGTIPGSGGAGKLDWESSYVCYGGGGVHSTGTAAKPSTTYGTNNTAVSTTVTNSVNGLPNTGGGGSKNGTGGSGKLIVRYPESYRQLYTATGAYTSYISGGYRYYVFTGNGTFRFKF